MASANWASSLGVTYTAASADEYRVSFRSNEMMGFPKAMYSMTLIHVDTSLSGLDGLGSRQMSAVDRYRSRSSSGMNPVNITRSATPSSTACASRAARESPSPMSTQ